MKRTRPLTLMVILVMLGSCGSTTVKKKVELSPLGKDEKVTVLTEIPTFGYEVVCEIDITRKGNFVSTKLESYKSNVEKIARECGTKLGLLTGLNGISSTSYHVGSAGLYSTTGYNIKVKGYAIRKTTDEARITSKKLIKKIATATSLDRADALKELLSDLKKDPKERSPYDNNYLSKLLFINASLGAKCPSKSVRYLMDEYNVGIDQVEISLGKYEKHPAGDLLYCENLLSKNYGNIKKKEDLVRYIHREAIQLLSRFRSNKSQLNKLDKLTNVLKLVTKDIKSACQQDSTSELCLFKGEFKAVQDHASKLKPQHRRSIQMKRLMNDLNNFMI